MSNSQDINHRPVRSVNNTEHLVAPANRLLGMAARAAWKGFKLLGGIIIRIPGWFVRANRRPSKEGTV
ncbi:MAG: hypothetical protein JST68_15375 [Bacteroidetes bacterium]|nr:hypothetical protein [Bacteroidota bacterium]